MFRLVMILVTYLPLLLSQVTAMHIGSKHDAAESAPTQLTIVTNCKRRIDEYGLYRLLDVPIDDWQYCSLNIIAPYDKKVQITIIHGAEMAGCQTDQSLLLLINGWMTSGSNVWPSSEHSSVRQCYKPSSTPTAITFSQNNAQIVYRFTTGEFVDIQVEFVDNEEPCTVMLSRHDLGKPITVHKHDGISRRCEVYIPGETGVNIDLVDSSNEVQLFSGNDNYWMAMTHVKTITPSDEDVSSTTVLLACTYARAIVTLSPGKQSVTFSYNYSDDRRGDIVREYARQCMSSSEIERLRETLLLVKRNREWHSDVREEPDY